MTFESTGPLRQVRSGEGSGFFEFLEGLAAVVLPGRQPVRAAAMNDRSGRTWAAELDVPGEDVNIVAFNQGLVLDQSPTQRDRVGDKDHDSSDSFLRAFTRTLRPCPPFAV